MNKSLEKYIATRDRRIMISSFSEFKPPLLTLFNELIDKGSVKVGGRATCGGGTDPTWRTFTSWNEVVRKARKFGYDISEAEIKHGNAYATNNGGFWQEREYTLNYPKSV